MDRRLIFPGLLIISIIFLTAVVEEKDSIEKAETVNKIELGNFGYCFYNKTISDFQNQHEIVWDVILDQDGLIHRRQNTNVVFENFIEQNKFEMTNLNYIRKRFEMAAENKNNYDYGVFLLQEEVFNPVIRVEWGYSNMSLWIIEGSESFEGIKVKLFKTWYIKRYGSWNQSWWDKIVSANDYNDPIVREWSTKYGLNLYKAWNRHMKNLGKKSAIIGLNGITSEHFSHEFEYYFPSPIRKYILKNYDLLFTYMDPMNSSEINRSEKQVKDLRRKYNYSGKIAHLLTSSFSSGQKWKQNVAYKEFKAVHPYVDVIMVYHFAKQWHDPEIPYPPILINFHKKFRETNN